ncbi:MAG: geranylgeranylglyceryl/heptaprenylglyceryl phosphate synthase, partial [Bacteroidetes bacterium HGW-Bacteroidetes-21]
MKTSLYNKLFLPEKKPRLAVLIDPDKLNEKLMSLLSNKSNRPDIILLGGSHVSLSVTESIEKIKKMTNLPLILFPGNPVQLSPLADAVLLLMLLSGRNADY